MNEKLILMIEDEESVLTLNERVLTRANNSIVCFKARTLGEARDMLVCGRDYDLIILDLMLPDGSGLDFISEINKVSSAPILILSAKNTPADIIEGAARGGDNYITKPYDPEAMAALAGAMLRREEKRREALQPGPVSRGPLTLDIASRRAYIDGKDAGLSPKEFALILTFVQNEGKTLSAEELYEAAWKLPAIEDTRTIKTHISKLRKKLSISDNPPLSICVEYRSGYRFEYREE